MTNWEMATKENLNHIVCKKFYSDVHINGSYKLTTQQKLGILQNVTENNKSVIRKIADYCFREVNNKNIPNIYLHISTKCNMSESTLRKILKYERKVTADFLGHICVGLSLSISESEELFQLWGYQLKFENSYFDAVTMTAIKDKDNIDVYEEELEYLKTKIK